MDSKHSQGSLEGRLAKFWALDELEKLVHQRDEIDQEHTRRLVVLRQAVAPGYSNTDISTTRTEFLRQIDADVQAHVANHTTATQLTNLKLSPMGRLWTEFRQHLLMAHEAKEEYDKAFEIAKTQINPAQFWARVAQAESWLDLRLPAEDIWLRACVNRVNTCRAAAFDFYHKEGSKLHDYHMKRLALVNETLGHSGELSLSPGTSECHTDNSEILVGSPPEEIEQRDNIRGPFAPVEYVNFLNQAEQGTPILGSALAANSGVLAKLILSETHDLHSPPLPIFTPPLTEDGNVLESMKCAFKLEERCNRSTPYEALLSVTNPRERGSFHLDKGWLLGLVLVNLPRPLIYLNEERIRAFRTSLPRDQIIFLFQKGTEEYTFFKRLWRHTNDVNIQLAASAITLAKGTEKIVCDIRSKWQIEHDTPLPSRRRWPSGDEGSGTQSKLLGIRRLSLGASARSAAS